MVRLSYDYFQTFCFLITLLFTVLVVIGFNMIILPIFKNVQKLQSPYSICHCVIMQNKIKDC